MNIQVGTINHTWVHGMYGWRHAHRASSSCVALVSKSGGATAVLPAALSDTTVHAAGARVLYIACSCACLPAPCDPPSLQEVGAVL